MIDYATLRLIWWALLGILLIGFAIMDGFDFGAAMLVPMIGQTDSERRVVINTVGPVWEGNQVWLILGAGAIFAAWPTVYAVSFSGFYLAMLTGLSALIIRPISFKYRSKLKSVRWRRFWDCMLALTGFLAPLVFGVAVGNVLQGVPFHFDETLRSFYTGSFFALFNPFALLTGLVSALFCLAHGCFYVAIKTEAPLAERALKIGRRACAVVVALFLVGGIWVAYGIKGYLLTHAIAHSGPSNPLAKSVITHTGAWLNNYHRFPLAVLAPALGIIGFLTAAASARLAPRLAFLCSSIGIAGIISTVGVSMFPFILPSSSNPNSSLLVWDASSSQLTLNFMLIATLIFLPIILLYTSWVYRVLKGKVTESLVSSTDNAY